MDLFFDLLRSVIYGVIEGITEWLPISSTGHMILAEQVLKFSFSAEFMEMFRVVIQLGAILAVVVMYFKKLWPFCVDNGRDSGLAKHVRWPVMRLWFKIIVACLPAAVLGLALDDWIDAHFYNSVVVAVMLIVYGIAFILIERRPRVPTTTKLSRITYRQALLVGAWQVLALIPGTSRSGSTIIGGLLCGMSRACASQFTFFLAIPVMAGASGLKLVKFLVTSCEWDEKLIRRAIVWLCKVTGKPILKLTDKDYNDNGLSELVALFGSAYNVNIRIFN